MALLFIPWCLVCLRQRRNEHIFAILYATFLLLIFVGVMVRLILTLAPIVCVTAAIACSQLLILH